MANKELHDRIQTTVAEYPMLQQVLLDMCSRDKLQFVPFSSQTALMINNGNFSDHEDFLTQCILYDTWLNPAAQYKYHIYVVKRSSYSIGEIRISKNP